MYSEIHEQRGCTCLMWRKTEVYRASFSGRAEYEEGTECSE